VLEPDDHLFGSKFVLKIDPFPPPSFLFVLLGHGLGGVGQRAVVEDTPPRCFVEKLFDLLQRFDSPPPHLALPGPFLNGKGLIGFKSFHSPPPPYPLNFAAFRRSDQLFPNGRLPFILRQSPPSDGPAEAPRSPLPSRRHFFFPVGGSSSAYIRKMNVLGPHLGRQLIFSPRHFIVPSPPFFHPFFPDQASPDTAMLHDQANSESARRPFSLQGLFIHGLFSPKVTLLFEEVN